MNRFILIFSLTIISIGIYSQTPNWQWAKSAGGTSFDTSTGIYTDADGNSYIIGFFNNPIIIFDNDTLTNNGSTDIYLVKYDATGNVIWAKSAGGASGDYATGISIDFSGNIYITGQFHSTTITFGSTILNNTGGYDIFVAKYDSSGSVLWAKNNIGLGDDCSYGICVDTNGNSYITGYFSGNTVTFGSTTLTMNGGSYSDLFVVKYNASGNVVWAKSAGGTVGDVGKSISVDANGNSYITGYFNSPTITFGSTTLINPYGGIDGTEDLFVAKYDSSGNALWAKRAGGQFIDNGNGISVDATGNSYVTGYFTDVAITFGSTTLTNTGLSNIFIVKYSPSGNMLWAQSATGISSYIISYGICNDAIGNVYVTGSFWSDTVSLGSYTLMNTNTNQTADIFVVKLDALGNVLWAKSSGGVNDDFSWCINSDIAGNSYLAGGFRSPIINFGSTSLTNASSGPDDIFVAKLSGTTGVDKSPNYYNNFKLYPNPANDNLNIDIEEKATLEIINAQGQIVETKSLTEKQNNFDLSNLVNGIYTLRIKTDRGIAIRKLVKQ